MLAPDHLQENFHACQRYLVVAGDQAFMAEESATFRRTGGAGAAQFLVMDLENLWGRLPLLIGDQTAFTKRELATAAGVTVDQITSLECQGLIGPGTGRPAKFSAVDLFTVCVVGSLRRAGVSKTAIRKAASYIRHGEPQTEAAAS